MLPVSKEFQSAMVADTRRTLGRVVVDFPGFQATYEGDDLISISLLEEREIAQQGLPVGISSANEIMVKLDNSTRRFDAGNRESPLYQLLVQNRRIRAWLGAEISGVVEWVPLGTFWSGEWHASREKLYASTTGRDRLEFLRKSTYAASQVFVNQSLHALATTILTNAGLTASECWVDPALQNIIVPNAWFGTISHREALRQIAEASLGQVYCDRSGVIRVEGAGHLLGQESFVGPLMSSVQSLTISADNYFSKDTPVKWGELVNRIEVETQPLLAAATAQEVFRSNAPARMVIGQSLQMTVRYNEAPAIEAVASLIGLPSAAITAATFYAWGADVAIHHSGGDIGTAIFTRASTAFQQNGASVASGVPRYEPNRIPGPRWRDLFDTDQIGTHYTSGGDTPATWTVSGGVLSATGGTQATLLRTGLTIADGEIIASVDQAQDGGLIARYVDNNNYYLLALRDDSSTAPTQNFRLFRRVAGAFTQLVVVDFTWARGVAGQIRFRFNGSSLEAWFNDTRAIAVTDTNFTSGGVGMGHHGDTATRFLDFAVHQVTSAIHLEEGTTNLLTANQASVETDLTGLTARVGTLTRDTTRAWHGTASGRIVPETPATPTTWTARTSGTTNALFGIAWSGTLWVAVGDGGVIRTSPDAITWTARTSGTTNALFGIARSASHLVWTTVSIFGDILISSDVITWSPITSGTTSWLYGIAAVGGLTVAVGNSGTILVSTNGTTYTPRNSGSIHFLYDIAAADSLWVAVGDGGVILTSSTERTALTEITGTVTVSPNTDYAFSGHLFSDGAANMLLQVVERDASNIWVATRLTHITTLSAFTRRILPFRTTATTTNILLQVQSTGTGTGWVDGLQLEQKPFAASWQLPGTARIAETLTIPSSVFNRGAWSVEGIYTPQITMNVGNVEEVLFAYDINVSNWLRLRVGWGGEWNFAITSGGVQRTIAGAGNAVLQGAAYQWMIAGDGTNMRLCVNGAQIGTDTAYTEPVGTMPANLFVGSHPNGTLQANGFIDDLRISNRARTLAEHQAAFSSGQPLATDADTTCLAKMDGALGYTGAADVTIVISGRPLRVLNAERVVAEDATSIHDNGLLRYEFPTNHLVQTRERAQAIADTLLRLYRHPRRDLAMDWRGNPALTLGDMVITRDHQDWLRYWVTKQEIDYDGALRARLEGRLAR